MKLTIVTTLGLFATVTLTIIFTLLPNSVAQKVSALDCDCVECICNPPQIATPELEGVQIPDHVQHRLNTIQDEVNDRIDQLNQRVAERLAPIPAELVPNHPK
ncbi:MAG TPA: hypothetical protein VH415_06345 [Nitrososphaeraceae archaeon]|jgi:hypothetical protein